MQFSQLCLASITEIFFHMPDLFHRRLSVPFGHVSFWHCNSHSPLCRVQQPKLVASHGMKKELPSSRIWHLRKSKVIWLPEEKSVYGKIPLEPVNPTASTCQGLRFIAQNHVALWNPSGRELAKIIHESEAGIKVDLSWGSQSSM